jgi:hypothetical protein
LLYCKNIYLEINAEDIKYIFMCCEQNARHNHNVKIGVKFFECTAKLRYLETTTAKLYS